MIVSVKTVVMTLVFVSPTYVILVNAPPVHTEGKLLGLYADS